MAATGPESPKAVTSPRDSENASTSAGKWIHYGGVEIRTRLGGENGAFDGQDRMLSMRADRHKDAASRDPDDFDALYSWALVLQEQAERAEAKGADASRRSDLLAKACARYDAAHRCRPRSHSTLYNWGIALGDRARMSADAPTARQLWGEACDKYRAAVECDVAKTQSTQALNNWGLALQQLATVSRERDEKRRRLLAAVGRFREAIRRDPSFHRAVYNLGTIMYALSEMARSTGGGGGGGPGGGGRRKRNADADAEDDDSDSDADADDSDDGSDDGGSDSGGDDAHGVGAESAPRTPAALQTAAATYICCAQASPGARPVYASSLRLVRRCLPAPALRAGTLLASPPSLPTATSGCWRERRFVLDHEAFWTAPGEGGDDDADDDADDADDRRGLGPLGSWASVPRPTPARGFADADPNDATTTTTTTAPASSGGTRWGVHVNMEDVVRRVLFRNGPHTTASAR